MRECPVRMLRRVRERGAKRRHVLTAHDAIDDRWRFEAGADDYLATPSARRAGNPCRGFAPQLSGAPITGRAHRGRDLVIANAARGLARARWDLTPIEFQIWSVASEPGSAWSRNARRSGLEHEYEAINAT